MLLDLLKNPAKYPFSAAAKVVRQRARVPDRSIDAIQKYLTLSKDVAVFAGKDGLFLVNRDDVYIGKCLELYGEYAGLEGEVIEGAGKLIERSRPTLYVENDRVEESAALISLIQDCGYRLWWHIPPLFNPGNFFNIKENKFGEVSSFNMLCVHRSSKMAFETLTEIKSSTDRHPLAG